MGTPKRIPVHGNVRRAWTHHGKLLGLSYFLTIRGLTTVNTRRLREVGLSREDYPADWDAFYDQVDRLTRRGIQDVFLPHWFNEYYGISWAYVWEVLNRGGMIADPVTHRPRVTVEGPAGETLRDWKRVWKSGALDEEVLSYTESSLVEGFASGRYLYSSQASYNLAQFNDPQRSPVAGHVDLVPFAGAGWGLLDSALYLTTSQERDADLDQDVKRFVSWYGYRDDTGEIAVGNRWMQTSMLFSAYRPVMESKASRAAMSRLLGSEDMVDSLLVLYANTPHPDGVWKVVWSEEFNSYLRKVLGNFLLRDEPVDEVVGDLAKEVERLNHKYGVP
jgi:multiple sugar transport system substrate-binding protein